MNPDQSNINALTNKSISWIDQIFGFMGQYSSLLVYGVLAMMIAKMAKFKVTLGGKH